MSGRIAIYTIAFDAKHRHLAGLMVESCRRWGKFDGDIIVFSNGSVDTAAQVESIVPHLRDIHGTYSDLFISKVTLGKLLLERGYDVLLYIDADCLILQNLDGFIDTLRGGLRFCEARIGWPVGRRDRSWHGGCLTPEEMREAREMCLAPINAGILGGPRSELERLFPEWDHIHEHEPFYGTITQYREQSALNRWAFADTRWEFFPDGWIEFGDFWRLRMRSDRTRILHFLHKNSDHMAEAFSYLERGEMP